MGRHAKKDILEVTMEEIAGIRKAIVETDLKKNRQRRQKTRKAPMYLTSDLKRKQRITVATVPKITVLAKPLITSTKNCMPANVARNVVTAPCRNANPAKLFV